MIKRLSENVASAILADVESGVSPGGKCATRVGSPNYLNLFSRSCPNPGGKMPPSTAGQRPAATFKTGSKRTIKIKMVPFSRLQIHISMALGKTFLLRGSAPLRYLLLAFPPRKLTARQWFSAALQPPAIAPADAA